MRRFRSLLVRRAGAFLNLPKDLKPSEVLETSEVSRVEIYDVMGMKVISDVRHLEDVGHLIRIDVSNLSPGVYFVKIGDRVEKFVKY